VERLGTKAGIGQITLFFVEQRGGLCEWRAGAVLGDPRAMGSRGGKSGSTANLRPAFAIWLAATRACGAAGFVSGGVFRCDGGQALLGSRAMGSRGGKSGSTANLRPAFAICLAETPARGAAGYEGGHCADGAVFVERRGGLYEWRGDPLRWGDRRP
jgi:hypothetical protein